MEFLLELLGELLIQIVVEFLVELGIHSIGERQRKPLDPWIAAIGYALFGAIVGGLSLLVFPHNLMPEAWRAVNIVLTPLAAGLAMMAMGTWRARRGDTRLRIDRFGYGYLFALAMALVRYQFAS
jgi:VIT1/CCC1 family predicted Fe2+/Mn2+ transporter